jgi:cytochrome b561
VDQGAENRQTLRSYQYWADSVLSPEFKYDRASIIYHWIVALLVIAVGAIGLLFDTLRPYKAAMLNIHALLGLFLYLLVLLRLTNRLTKPAAPPVAGASEAMTRLATAMHALLYAFLVAIPGIGLVSFIWHARTFNLGFASFTPVPVGAKAIYHPTQVVHIWMAYVFMAAISLHALAALWHHYIKRDDTLSRMAPLASPKR